MSNKDRNKRSVRKARAEERAQREAAQAQNPASAPKEEKKPVKAAAKEKNPGFFRRIANYLGEVRSEMKRVVWPSRKELKSYSVAVLCTLLVFGVIIWLVDSGIVAALVGLTGLRG